MNVWLKVKCNMTKNRYWYEVSKSELKLISLDDVLQHKLTMGRRWFGNHFFFVVYCPICANVILDGYSQNTFSDTIDLLCRQCRVIWRFRTAEVFEEEGWIPAK